jgi:hypothetical protein
MNITNIYLLVQSANNLNFPRLAKIDMHDKLIALKTIRKWVCDLIKDKRILKKMKLNVDIYMVKS